MIVEYVAPIIPPSDISVELRNAANRRVKQIMKATQHCIVVTGRPRGRKTGIKDASGANLRCAGITDAPSRSRPVRRDVRVARSA